MANRFPKVYRKFQDLTFEATTYATQWFMTLFCVGVPFKTVVRIWDSFFVEGLKIIYRVGLAIIRDNEKAFLKSKSFEELQVILKMYTADVEPDRLLTIAFNIHLSRREIEVGFTLLRNTRNNFLKNDLFLHSKSTSSSPSS